MDRRKFLSVSALAGIAIGSNARGQEPKPAPKPSVPADVNQAPGVRASAFALDEVTVSDLQRQMRQGAITAERIAQLYLERIEEIDRRGPALRAVIELNPDALSIARSLDVEFKTKGPRSPLHGIPVLLKDNIDTADKMQTTGG